MSPNKTLAPQSIEARFVTPNQRMAHEIYSFMKERRFDPQEVEYESEEGHEWAQFSRVINGAGERVVQLLISQPRRSSPQWVIQIQRTRKKYEMTCCTVDKGATQTVINSRQRRPNPIQLLSVYMDLGNVSRAIRQKSED